MQANSYSCLRINYFGKPRQAPSFFSFPTILTKKQWVQCQREENVNLCMAILHVAPFSLPGSSQSPVPPNG